MGALLFFIPVIAIIVAVFWDLSRNPYRIEEDVLGTPPTKTYFIYARGPQLVPLASFFSRQAAEDWVATATALKRGLPLPSKKD